MNNTDKLLLIWGDAIFSFSMAVTSPTIQLYFMRLVDSQVFASSIFFQTILSACTQTYLKDANRRNEAKRWFFWFILLDVVGMFAVSLVGIDYPNLRFLGFTVFNSITVGFWVAIMTGVINDQISNEELTDFQLARRSYSLWATSAGGLVAITIISVDIPIIVPILFQCMGNLCMGVMDYKVYRNLT